MEYIKRVIEPVIVEYTKSFPVIALTGPRQSGKSTTLLKLFNDYRYVTFDDYKVLRELWTFRLKSGLRL